MAVTGVTTQPQVVKMGGAFEERYAYLAGGVDTIVAGDLIRINDAGAIDLAEVDSAGAVHGIALEANAGAATVLPVLLFAPDTVVKIQTIDGQSPADLELGEEYTLEKGTGVWGVTATTTNGVALVVDRASNGQPFYDRTGAFDEHVSTAAEISATSTIDDNKSVLVRFTSNTLDAQAAAASS